ncbi:hypothetical protein [Nocardioides sp. T2.26MG-1]|uniref:hypothetical protein n=1 Tax=Nocardioides sp. T2.26MG-1 TaxID=3041166 RepID=UPI0024773812|nr:hypothetical protein [Nocardioides sp. T2.26MG-1]CAI9408402.1 hypothetical protein HIDPHFAB_01072 [Nocardioides sp. T2.26MG-1]
MAKRGFFAEINYQAQQAEKRQRQQYNAAVRAHATAQRAAEKARRDAERARAAAARATDAQRKAAEKEAAQLYAESRVAETEEMNAELASTLGEIDALLAATLEVDDFVDLEEFKVSTVEHPPFEPGALATPTPPMPELVYPPEPPYAEPPAPTGLSGAFGGKKKHAEVVEQARAAHAAAVQAWRDECTRMYNAHLSEQGIRRQREADRVAKLAEAEAAYQAECRQREVDAEARNAEVTKLINDLAFDVPAAIEEYVGIVLSNSVYPESFPVSHEYQFDLATRELTLAVTVPEPSTVPAVKEYRYVKAKDEIAATMLPVKAQKDRYASAVSQVAVRTLHEIFEADRAAKIRSIALTVGVNRTAPATGLPETVPLVVVGADRDTFTTFDLANVVPDATLAHLGAAVSKSPFDLTPADASKGVRVRGQA